MVYRGNIPASVRLLSPAGCPRIGGGRCVLRDAKTIEAHVMTGCVLVDPPLRVFPSVRRSRNARFPLKTCPRIRNQAPPMAHHFRSISLPLRPKVRAGGECGSRVVLFLHTPVPTRCTRLPDEAGDTCLFAAIPLLFKRDAGVRNGGPYRLRFFKSI